MQAFLSQDVHYKAHGSLDGKYPPVCRAAKVTEVHDGDPVPESGVYYVALCVMNPTGLFFKEQVKYDSGVMLGGTWHHSDQCGDQIVEETVVESPAPPYVHRIIDSIQSGAPLDFKGAKVPKDVQDRLGLFMHRRGFGDTV